MPFILVSLFVTVHFYRKKVILATTEKGWNDLVSEPNYHTTNFFSNRNKKSITFINEPVCLGLSILELSKMLMYEVWYHYVKPKYGEKVTLCYMNTNSFIVYIKTDVIYKDIPEDVQTRFDALNYE